jgi:hypothetical protein
MLAMFVANGVLDRPRFVTEFRRVMTNVAERWDSEHRGIVLFGEGVQLLWENGNLDAAIQIEHLCDRLASLYDIEILCGYCLWRLEAGMEEDTFKQICREHSSVFSL